MPRDLARIESYVDRSCYQKALGDLRAEHSYEYYIGKKNPYNGKRISTEEDAELYLQHLAMSVMYRQAANIALAKIRQDTDQRIGELEGNVRHLQAEQNENLTELFSIRSQLQKAQSKKRAAKLVAILLAAVLGFGYYAQSFQQKQQYSSAYDAGYEVGYKSGSKDTKALYDRALSGAAAGSDKTLQDYIEEGRAEAAASSKTKDTTPSSYKTTPRSGISLTRTVYVSRKGKIHLRKNCSGMKYSTAMTYGEACEEGYVHCKKCF